MKRKLFAMLLATAMLTGLTGCGGGAKTESAAPMAPMPAPEASAPMEDAKAEMPSGTVSMGTQVSGGGENGSVYQRADAKLIRRCEIGLQTTQFDDAVSALYALVDSVGGYFESAYTYGGGYRDVNGRRNAEYIIRVPAQQYNQFQKSVGELAYVTHSSESTEDIGLQYYDTQARLEMLRTKQERLLNLLEKAETMEDIITLESALGEVEYEIERYSSTLNRYDSLVNYSTFTVYLNEVVRVDETVGEKDSLGTRMKAGFISSVEDLVDGVRDTLIWFSYNIITLGIVAVIVVVMVVVSRKYASKIEIKHLGKKKDDSQSQ